MQLLKNQLNLKLFELSSKHLQLLVLSRPSEKRLPTLISDQGDASRKTGAIPPTPDNKREGQRVSIAADCLFFANQGTRRRTEKQTNKQTNEENAKWRCRPTTVRTRWRRQRPFQVRTKKLEVFFVFTRVWFFFPRFVPRFLSFLVRCGLQIP